MKRAHMRQYFIFVRWYMHKCTWYAIRLTLLIYKYNACKQLKYGGSNICVSQWTILEFQCIRIWEMEVVGWNIETIYSLFCVSIEKQIWIQKKKKLKRFFFYLQFPKYAVAENSCVGDNFFTKIIIPGHHVILLTILACMQASTVIQKGGLK